MKLQGLLSKTWSKITLLGAWIMIALTSMNVNSVKADNTLWDENAGTGLGNVITKLTDLYRKWSLPFIFISLILYAFTKDERKREAEKKAIIVMVAIYILTFIWTWVTGSMDAIGNTLTGQ